MGVPAIGTGIQGNHVFDNGGDVPIFDNDIYFLVDGSGVSLLLSYAPMSGGVPRTLPSMSSDGAPALVPAPMHGL